MVKKGNIKKKTKQNELYEDFLNPCPKFNLI